MQLYFKIAQTIMEAGYIRRELSGVIEEAARYFSVITITGPRQSGKTTLIRNEFGGLPYYSLENLDVRSYAENDPVAFLNQHSEGMILDEAHNAPNLLSYIQGIVDEHPERRFILSGSSQFAMLRKVTQSLAGRTAVFELLPLSYCEISRWTICCSTDSIRLSMRAATSRNSFIRRISRLTSTRTCATCSR